MKSVVITGVSSGIGRSIAARLIEDGWHVFGSVRNSRDADTAREALGTAFEPLVFDVTDQESIDAAADLVGQKLAGATLGGLVNNAGISSAGPMRYVPIEQLQTVFDVNVYGVLRTTRAFLPLLGADHARTGAPGKIINLSSVSGKISVPFMGPYSMSKFAVEAMSDALRVELSPHGIDVIIIEPGPVNTPIFDKTDAIDFSPYDETEYAAALARVKASSRQLGSNALDPDQIGRLVVQIFKNPSPKPRYPVMKNKLSRWTLPRLLPERVLDRALSRRVGLSRRK